MSRIPSLRRHKSGRAVVTLSYKSKTGGKTKFKDVYLGQYGTKESKKKYDLVIANWLTEERGEKAPPPTTPRGITDNITVVEACAKYLSYMLARPNASKSEVAHVKSMIRIVRSLYEFELASNIGPAELRQIRQSMLKYGARKNKSWSRQYVNEQISRVKKMYKWLAAEPLIPVTVYQALLLVSGLRCGEEQARETDPVLPVDDVIVDATLQHLPETVVDMVQLQRKTGMRPAEVCSLRPCEVNRSGDVWLYQPKKHKTSYRGRERVIFIGPQAQSILFCYLARDAESYCFSPKDSEVKRRVALCKQGNRPVTTTRAFCEHYKVTAYRRAVHRACDKAFPAPEEMKEVAIALAKWQSDHRWSPNQLRHATATRIRREFGLEAAQVVLGHSRADVTQIYAERDIAKGVDVARKIG